MFIVDDGLYLLIKKSRMVCFDAFDWFFFIFFTFTHTHTQALVKLPITTFFPFLSILHLWFIVAHNRHCCHQQEPHHHHHPKWRRRRRQRQLADINQAETPMDTVLVVTTSAVVVATAVPERVNNKNNWHTFIIIIHNWPIKVVMRRCCKKSKIWNGR